VKRGRHECYVCFHKLNPAVQAGSSLNKRKVVSARECRRGVLSNKLRFVAQTFDNELSVVGIVQRGKLNREHFCYSELESVWNMK
jgi:hypothetical protein